MLNPKYRKDDKVIVKSNGKEAKVLEYIIHKWEYCFDGPNKKLLCVLSYINEPDSIVFLGDDKLEKATTLWD